METVLLMQITFFFFSFFSFDQVLFFLFSIVYFGDFWCFKINKDWTLTEKGEKILIIEEYIVKRALIITFICCLFYIV